MEKATLGMTSLTSGIPGRLLTRAAEARAIGMNLALICAGSIIFVYGMNAIMIPAKLFSGGLAGLALLIKYRIAWVDVGAVYLLLNIPLIILGWVSISRRFIAYTIFGIAFFSLSAALIHPPAIVLRDTLLAALLAGVICGLGSGLILRSLGSAGGMDILAVTLNKRFGLRVGTISFATNTLVIIAGIWFHDLDLSLYSLILLFTSGSVVNMVISGFNARMAVMVISDRPEGIAQEILYRLDRGVTYLDGQGAFSHRPKRVIMTVTTMTELPKLKEIIFTHDPLAFVVINNTFEVLGQRHGAMRVY